MKVINTITMLTGTVMTSLGLLSMYPSLSVWQRLLLAVYESQGVLLLTGIALTLSSFIVMRGYRTPM